MLASLVLGKGVMMKSVVVIRRHRIVGLYLLSADDVSWVKRLPAVSDISSRGRDRGWSVKGIVGRKY